MDFSEIKEITSQKGATKNPYYESLVKNGFSIRVNYSPDDVAEMIAKRHNKLSAVSQTPNNKADFDLFQFDDEEVAALEEYRKAKAQ